MTSEQETLYLRAKESLAAAKLFHQSGYYGFAASRAYYAIVPCTGFGWEIFTNGPAVIGT
jgi:uncharacterized protein (UPF0332 family)